MCWDARVEVPIWRFYGLNTRLLNVKCCKFDKSITDEYV